MDARRAANSRARRAAPTAIQTCRRQAQQAPPQQTLVLAENQTPVHVSTASASLLYSTQPKRDLLFCVWAFSFEQRRPERVF